VIHRRPFVHRVFAAFLQWALACAFFSSPVAANTCTTVSSGFWSAPSVWVSGVRPQAGDTVLIGIGDTVQLDGSTPALAEIVVSGVLQLGTDTLELQATANPGDTLVHVSGTLDMGSGWFLLAQNAAADTARPIMHLGTGALFRTSAVFPYPSPGLFDSNASPLFALDPASTFEYYSGNLDKIDVSYLLNNIIGHAYRNLVLTQMVASFVANPLVVMDTFVIGFGASTIGAYTPQTVTISGDVMNENTGPSGAAGAGLRGCGMLSLGEDTWVFDAKPGGVGKDTCHWSGPSQMGTADVRANTVLSIRFVNDTVCDSLDVLNGLIEEGMPCGGHAIGKVFSEFPRLLDSLHTVDTFAGLTVRSGKNPYLGWARILRTTGYAPPGADPNTHPVLRYYEITTENGPQETPDTISAQVHCDEFNAAEPGALHFWRSRDRGNAWAFSGLLSYDAASNVFTWDTTVLGWPNDSGNFYWMLSEGYTDTPLPDELESFSALAVGMNVWLTWHMASEANVAGYEIERQSGNDTTLIASYETADSLRAKGAAAYDFLDTDPLLGSVGYVLFEITRDGIRSWLGSRTVELSGSASDTTISDLVYAGGELQCSVPQNFSGTIAVSDRIGRTLLSQSIQPVFSGRMALPLSLVPGVYFIEISGGNVIYKNKFVVSE